MFRYTRSYAGPVQAVIFDWAGTTVDFGCFAPVEAFRQAFARKGVDVTATEARAPMGAEKRRHIELMLSLPGLRSRWIDKHGQAPTEADIDALYDTFLPLQLEALAGYAEPVPGCVETVEGLRRRGIRIGSTTGYPREVIDQLALNAADRGYRPDHIVAAGDGARGRPSPDMCLMNLVALQIDPVAACVVVDDSPTGLEAGLNAGMWTVAVAVSGSDMGLSVAEWRALEPRDQQERLTEVTARLAATGVHYVIETVADLPAVIDDIEGRMARGETP